MIEAKSLTKRYGDTVAVDDLTFTVQPGMVTGFLGPNGAGKSTTMRMILGLDRPSSGSVLVDGKPYVEHTAPLRVAGALLEARAVHTSRSARNHLAALAATHGIPRSRVDEVIDFVGLDSVAGKRAGGFSLGMGQRLGIASALLGDPSNLLLDEPVNGLDPEGILWIRTTLQDLAREGRTVLVSSHLMSEMALTAEHLIVIGQGRLIADTTTADFIATASDHRVLVSSPDAARLAEALRGPEVTITQLDPSRFEVSGVAIEEVGRAAAASGIVLHELRTAEASLEEAFMSITHDAVQYQSHTSRPATDELQETHA